MSKSVRYPSARETLKFDKAIYEQFPDAVRHMVQEVTAESVVYTVKFADGSTTSISFNR